MADAYNEVGGGHDFVQAAFEAIAEQPFRSSLYFDSVADVKPIAETNAGTSLTWTEVDDLPSATTALNEITDSDAVAFTTSQIALTIAEQGSHTKTTGFLNSTSLFGSVDSVVAELVGRQAGVTMDELARAKLIAGTNVAYGGAATSRATVAAGHIITASDFRTQVAALRNASVPGRHGRYYTAFVNPDVHYDLIEETGESGWRHPQVNLNMKAIQEDVIGFFAGCLFVETPTAPIIADGGVTTTDVYQTLIVGQKALAKRWSKQHGNGPQPQFVLGPQTDALRRHKTYGWKWLGGYGVHRQDALRRIESSSSLGANT